MLFWEDNLLLRGSRLVSWYKRWGTWLLNSSGSWWREAAQLCCQDHTLISHPASKQKWQSTHLGSSVVSQLMYPVINETLQVQFLIDADKALTVMRIASYLQMHRSSPSQCWVLSHSGKNSEQKCVKELATLTFLQFGQTLPESKPSVFAGMKTSCGPPSTHLSKIKALYFYKIRALK